MNWNTIEIKIASAERSQVLHWQLLLLTSDWITSLIEFLGDKLLCGHVPDPFSRCGTGSCHVRLVRSNNADIVLYTIPSYAVLFPSTVLHHTITEGMASFEVDQLLKVCRHKTSLFSG